MTDLPAVRFSNPSALHRPFGYSHVAEIVSGRMIYLAGQVALDIDGNLVGRDDFEAQVRQAFANVAAALEAAGADFRHVIKLTYYCADSVDLEVQLPAVRTIRDRFVNTASPPASTFLVVRSLARRDFLVEVEAIAVV